MTQLVEPLDLSEAAALTNVAELLDESSRRVSDVTPAGRHLAVVLLDGAVEAAIAVCLSRFSESSSDRMALVDNHKVLMKHLRERKNKVIGWHEVAKLRRARNLSQHHQIPIDAEALKNLEGPVNRYIDTIVMETFSIRLNQVSMAAAVTDEDFRKTLQDIHDQIDSEDTAGAKDAMAELYRSIVREIGGSRVEHFGFRRPIRRTIQLSSRTIGGSNPQRDADMSEIERWAREAQRSIDEARSFNDASPFASDLSEFVWFRRVVLELDQIAVDEARRAYRFLVRFIARWEAYLETEKLLSDRQAEIQRWNPSPDPSGRPAVDGPPAVSLDRSVTGTGQFRLDLAVKIGIEGDSTNANLWDSALAGALRSRSETSNHRFVMRRWDGISVLGVTQEDFEIVRSEVDEILDDANERFKTLQQAEETNERQAMERREKLADLAKHAAKLIDELGLSQVFGEPYTDDHKGIYGLSIAEDYNEALIRELRAGSPELPVGDVRTIHRSAVWTLPSNVSEDSLTESIAEVVRSLTAPAAARRREAIDLAATIHSAQVAANAIFGRE